MRTRALPRLVAALLAFAVVAAGCGDDGTADVVPDPNDDVEAAPSTEPPATDPPASGPPVTESPVTEPPVTEPPPDITITLDIVDGQLVGGARDEAVPLGEEVTIVATGDTDGEIHVHGYDRFVDLVGGEGEVTFDAEIPGIFEVELEATGRLLIRLEVS